MSCHNNKEDQFDILIILCWIMIIIITVTIFIINKVNNKITELRTIL
jgi:hypothetical protein